MKKNLIFASLFTLTAMTATAQVYLDPNAPIEERVKDALSRMTTHEKVQILHAQSKFRVWFPLGTRNSHRLTAMR